MYFQQIILVTYYVSVVVLGAGGVSENTAEKNHCSYNSALFLKNIFILRKKIQRIITSSYL